jgi:hypothetical protein
MAVIVVENPTKVEVPRLSQPPALLNWVKTDSAVARGAKTHRGIIMAKRPTMWRIRIRASTIGSLLARKVLKKIENVVIEMTRRVPCHRSYT